MAHFSAEETELQRLNNRLEITGLKSGRVQTQAGLSNLKAVLLITVRSRYKNTKKLDL